MTKKKTIQDYKKEVRQLKKERDNHKEAYRLIEDRLNKRDAAKRERIEARRKQLEKERS